MSVGAFVTAGSSSRIELPSAVDSKEEASMIVEVVPR